MKRNWIHLYFPQDPNQGVFICKNTLAIRRHTYGVEDLILECDFNDKTYRTILLQSLEILNFMGNKDD